MATKIRYRIIPIEVSEPGQIVEISHKLPLHLKVCTGFIARHTKGLKLTNNKNEIGLLALEFNSRKQLLINAMVGYESRVEQLPDYQEVNIPLENGQLLTGYYMDTKQIAPADFNPYTIQVYLRCELEVTDDSSVCTTT